MENEFKIIDKCRFCNSSKLSMYLNLGKQPLANNLLDSPNQECNTYPLEVYYCNDCKMSQLSCVVNPNILYKHYLYRSGMSETFRKHCEKLADEIIEKIPVSGLVVDLASNDGTFLNEFGPTALSLKNIKTLGIEPATNLCKISNERGVNSINKFFNYQTAMDVTLSHGQADYITAQNVFAHVEDVFGFMHGIHYLLKDTGTLIVEAPYVGDLIEKMDLGQVYFEHCSYLSVTGMKNFIKQFNMHLNNVKYFPEIHGGTLRYYINKYPDISNLYQVENFCYRETFTEPLRNTLQNRIDYLKIELKNLIKNDMVEGVGAAAKATTICNYFEIKNRVSRIYDTTPDKIGKYIPNTGIPIMNFKDIQYTDNKIIIFPHNLKYEIITNVRKLNPNAKFINLIPNLSEE